MTTPEVTDLGSGNGCVGIERIESIAAGDIASASEAAHFSICLTCTELLHAVKGDNDFLAEVKGAGPIRRSLVPADAMDDGPVPGYKLLGELHRGGQGVVYRAEQLATRRSCAVKQMLGGGLASGRARRRFEREVELVAKMRHPGVVTLYESGVARDGEPFFAMELVAGERFDTYVRMSMLTTRQLIELFRNVVDAVAYAHRRGVIHRDLKPGNVLVDTDGNPRVLDFGLARPMENSVVGLLEGFGGAGGETMAGEFLGTFAYAAPEQLRGDPDLIDSRIDIYALGVMLYESLCGSKPFVSAANVADLLLQRLDTKPKRPSELRAGIDRDLDVITLKLLDPNPDRRYGTADELRDELDRYLEGKPILAREDSVVYVAMKTMRRYRVASSAAGLILAIIVGASIALSVAYARTEEALGKSEKSLSSLKNSMTRVDPELGRGSSQLDVNDFLALVTEQVNEELGDDPELLAGILVTLGLVHLGFDDAAGAKDAIERAHQIRSDGYARGDVTQEQMAEVEFALARLRFNLGDFAASERAYQAALALYEAALGPNALATVETMRQLASAQRAQQKFTEARCSLKEAFDRSASLEASQEAAIAKAAILNGMAALGRAEGDIAATLPLYREALAALGPYVDADDFRIGRTLYSIALMQEVLDDRASAAENAMEAHRILFLRKGPDAKSTKDAAALLERLRPFLLKSE
ncbi:MAG: serine/threonine protein kinase [Phycisphaerales bacterium]|nr:serine/threonine protein kinase [Phycisphaerales bacterium]